MINDLKITEAEYQGNDMASTNEDYYEGQADWLKERFDALSKNVIIPKLNALIDELAKAQAAKYIGAVALNSNSGENVQDVVNYLWEQIQKISLGSVPDDSISESKLTADSVTEEKIVDGAVTENKIADESITTAKLALGAVITDIIMDGNVTEGKLSPELQEKLADYVTSGAFEEAMIGKVNKTDVLTVAQGGTGATTLNDAMHILKILPTGWSDSASVKGTFITFSNLNYVPWYTANMSTYAFLEAMPQYTGLICYSNKSSGVFSDELADMNYPILFFYKGNASHYSLVLAKPSNILTFELYGYTCNDKGSGKWTKII